MQASNTELKTARPERRDAGWSSSCTRLAPHATTAAQTTGRTTSRFPRAVWYVATANVAAAATLVSSNAITTTAAGPYSVCIPPTKP
jgi:hypothetical protein